MPETTVQLEELETRVAARYSEKMAALWTLPDSEFSTVEFGPDWANHLKPSSEPRPTARTIEISTVDQPLPPPIVPLPPPIMQFPPRTVDHLPPTSEPSACSSPTG